MRLLLDSQVFYWLLHLPERVGPKARKNLADRANELWYSALTPWELAIKRAKGALRFDDAALLRGIDAFRLRELPISTRHGLAAAALPAHHRDPFDRLLVSQALVEKLPILSTDPQISRYPIETLW